jgi:hypothetical protein
MLAASAAVNPSTATSKNACLGSELMQLMRFCAVASVPAQSSADSGDNLTEFQTRKKRR